jgi:hypothetical protein
MTSMNLWPCGVEWSATVKGAGYATETRLDEPIMDEPALRDAIATDMQ